ncbi:alkaline phosphatase family protein [Bacillus sp. EB01]|uniref:alkaline phosphatase family protein n=1 Tax=Bacillus sp. EB01 TaxID=1347086 RepID=UPI0005C783C0|nr:alkaline phosphatase family protein [Bacillus sp. EB01]
MQTVGNGGEHPAKPIIMIIVDTLMDEPLREAMQTGMAPAMKFLAEKGNYYPNLVAPFPTMSVNVDTTLLTGTYCHEHKIPGLVWFCKKENRLVNYGTHYRELLKLGLGQAVEDLLFNMNEAHISKKVTTIHEDLEKKGLESASINALVFRGPVLQTFDIPRFAKAIAKIKTNQIHAPRYFSYGRFAKLSPSNRNQHFWQKGGVNDLSSVQQLEHLIKSKHLPSFSLVYLPDLDQRIHKNGRMDLKGIKNADKQIQKLLDLYGDWNRALEENVWVAMGDNGQAWVHPKRSQAVVDLKKALHSFKIMGLRKGLTPSDQVILAVNDRMAYVYSNNLESLPLEMLAQELHNEKRIDIIAWKHGGDIMVKSTQCEGELRFRPNGDYQDEYGQSWQLKGEPSILNLKLESGFISYGNYPDALARLYSSLYSHEGDFLVVSAMPGYELAGEGSPLHLGGAGHGGLHKQDSIVPMIIAGTDSSPDKMRIVDLKKWLLTLI